MKKELSIRLSTVANLIKRDSVVADIGCDHAFLSIYLIESGIAKKVYASDVNVGPLEIAKKHVAEANLTDKIKTVLSDGLENIPDECDEIVIAGMGGLVISKILDNCDRIKSERVGLVLQPMSDAITLRRYLAQNGFEIITETAFEDAGHLYSAMRVTYSGKAANLEEWQYYVGGLGEKNDADAKLYIEKERDKLYKKIKGISASTPDDRSVALYRETVLQLERVLDSF